MKRGARMWSFVSILELEMRMKLHHNIKDTASQNNHAAREKKSSISSWRHPPLDKRAEVSAIYTSMIHSGSFFPLWVCDFDYVWLTEWVFECLCESLSVCVCVSVPNYLYQCRYMAVFELLSVWLISLWLIILSRNEWIQSKVLHHYIHHSHLGGTAIQHYLCNWNCNPSLPL